MAVSIESMNRDAMPARARWCIGIYSGPSPLRLGPPAGVANPVLSATSVTDVAARFVADPFMIRAGAAWHMFFEIMPAAGRKGVIGHATSLDGLSWRYDRIVLEESFHLSYPCVIEAGDAFYLVPESHEAGAIRLYRAEAFPDRWSATATLVEGDWVEPTVFPWGDRWWLMAATPARHATELHLFEATELTGPWREHPMSPLVRSDPASARPAGRVVAHGGTLLRFAQDCSRRYGERVRAFEIVELTRRRYRERAVEVSLAAEAWNAARMHHVDAHELGDGQWIACVDCEAASSNGEGVNVDAANVDGAPNPMDHVVR